MRTTPVLIFLKSEQIISLTTLIAQREENQPCARKEGQVTDMKHQAPTKNSTVSILVLAGLVVGSCIRSAGGDIASLFLHAQPNQVPPRPAPFNPRSRLPPAPPQWFTTRLLERMCQLLLGVFVFSSCVPWYDFLRRVTAPWLLFCTVVMITPRNRLNRQA